MAEPLKLMYSGDKLSAFARILRKAYPGLDEKKFLAHFSTTTWKNAELKQRVKLVAEALQAVLPGGYARNLEILIQVSPQLQPGFFPIFLPEYVDMYGQDHFDDSMFALGVFTSSSSAEFAIRSFIQRDPKRTMKQMVLWSKSKDHHQRRLASEGCRPRLPWGKRLDIFIEDPSPVIAILERLKNDPELYVRKSVANNLNDISRDHPQLALELGEKWSGISDRCDWVVQHGLRTLLKQGNKQALSLFGHHEAEHLEAKDLKVDKSRLRIGDHFLFAFTIFNKSQKEEACRIEYAIDFVKSNGKNNRKVFQISKAQLSPGQTMYSKKHSFADLTTRRHYPGEHSICILLNGEEKAAMKFVLLS